MHTGGLLPCDGNVTKNLISDAVSSLLPNPYPYSLHIDLFRMFTEHNGRLSRIPRRVVNFSYEEFGRGFEHL